MTSGDFLHLGEAQLKDAGIQTARLDCLVLLSDILEVDKANILAHPDQQLTEAQQRILEQHIADRVQHIPLAYIRGRAMFYGREFAVSPAVLVPRPETESIITLLLGLTPPSKPRIADIGCGSGCIGITIALELPGAAVDLYDIDDAARVVASQNAATLKANVGIAKSDLLRDISKDYDVILANLPYVPDNFPINEAAGHEPDIALFSGIDGLDHYRAFWTQVQSLESHPAYIITESLPSQHHANAMLARHAGFILEKNDGFAQLFVRA